MTYFVDESAYLMHYGVKGMKWGVRKERILTGRRRKSSISEKTIEARHNTADDLMHELDGWAYGPVVNGKPVDSEGFNWEKDYRTQTIEQLKKSKCGVCWDFVNYQHDVFKKNGIPDKTYMFIMDRGKEGFITHTWSQVDLGDGQYWFENSFYKKRGLHKIQSEKDVIQSLRDEYDPSGKLKFDVYQFNPDGLDKGLTDQEYFDRVTDSGKYILGGD